LLAAVAAGFDAKQIEGSYSDPNHPGCARYIQVLDQTTGEVTGNDAPDGSEPWGPLNAIIDGQTVVVDFSPKGGPSDLTGTYTTPEGENAGITWADGNRWTQLKVKDSSVPFNNHWVPKEGEKYCYALAMSGGGSFGTYETGVVWGLLHYGNPEYYEWDVFTGVSAGSINAAMFSVWPKGKEVEMSENVSYMCTLTTFADVVANWPGLLPGPIEGLIHHAGLFDNSPMTDYLNDYFGNFTQIEKKVVLSAVDVESGEYTRFDESMGIENLGTIVRASSSIPVAFPPTEY